MTHVEIVTGSQPRFASDLTSQPPALIHLSHQLVDVDDVGLELDHDEGAQAAMPRQDVDHAALAVDRERHLRIKHPLR